MLMTVVVAQDFMMSLYRALIGSDNKRLYSIYTRVALATVLISNLTIISFSCSRGKQTLFYFYLTIGALCCWLSVPNLYLLGKVRYHFKYVIQDDEVTCRFTNYCLVI